MRPRMRLFDDTQTADAGTDEQGRICDPDNFLLDPFRCVKALTAARYFTEIRRLAQEGERCHSGVRWP